MTLSPVFRSQAAIQLLHEQGLWERLAPAARGQAEATASVRGDLADVLDAKYVGVVRPDSVDDLEFLQQFFFLILFRAVLASLGLAERDLRFCSELNFCIKGTITAADNLFDDQDKLLLPLEHAEGARFRAILQLLAFERLTQRVLARGVESGAIPAAAAPQISRELLSRMSAIGSLEGSEEAGVRSVLPPDEMIERVHRLRGGALFELAFVGPRLLHNRLDAGLLDRAEAAVSRLGTAFQIVDDLTDFEFDLAHGRQNILVSQIVHCGSSDERACLRRLTDRPSAAGGDVVADHLVSSARAVIARGEREMEQALDSLQSLGFWLPAGLGSELLRAIVGADGVDRVRAL